MRRPVGLLVVAAALLSACRFEKRPDLASREPAEGTTVTVTAGGPVEDSVRAALAAVSEAFAVGDVTRVAQLTTPGAVLIDQEDEVRWTRDGTERLPLPLVGGADGSGWTLAGSTFSLLAPDAALVSLDYASTATTSPPASATGEAAPATAVESWVVVRTDAGWRVGYLHRSRGLGQSAARP